jgi:hypothetical protein
MVKTRPMAMCKVAGMSGITIIALWLAVANKKGS